MHSNVIDLLGMTADPTLRTPKAAYYTNLVDRAPNAYLHTVFTPVSEHVLRTSALRMRIPHAWQYFLQFQNGANLFFNSLYLYGVLEEKSKLNRTTERIVNPFGIEEQNIEANLTTDGEWLLIGSYGFDGSKLCLSRVTSRVQTVGARHRNVIADWPNVEHFLTEEIGRLSSLFTPAGKLLVDEKFTSAGTTPVI